MFLLLLPLRCNVLNVKTCLSVVNWLKWIDEKCKQGNKAIERIGRYFAYCYLTYLLTGEICFHCYLFSRNMHLWVKQCLYTWAVLNVASDNISDVYFQIWRSGLTQNEHFLSRIKTEFHTHWSMNLSNFTFFHALSCLHFNQLI